MKQRVHRGVHDVTQGSHAVLLLDGAGWHQTGGKLRVPGNISLLPLPPYSPELNPVENIWQFLHQNRLRSSGFAVDAVDSGIEAIIAARKRPPGLIIVAVQLRDVPGREALNTYRLTPVGS